MPNLAEIRTEYRQQTLSESEVNPDPVRQLILWLEHAITAKVNEPTAMVVATSTLDGQPSARILLCKGIEDGKVIFFTNYQSRKGMLLAANPRAAITFFWPELERQIRIEGVVARIPPAESDAYFASRPLGSRLGAWASPQSQVIASRDILESNLAAAKGKYTAENVPRPPYWGGYGLAPNQIEFWQGRQSRLHDRIEYVRNGNGWQIQRLAP
ncbi:MAG TPA: pyridoxamine 5'-phosphate oxidase [Tepidisphaeraceae bacterium]|jgi:pyridoxamine 5'-phosphate oxidase